MAVKKPMASSLCSLTVVREPSKPGWEQTPFSEPKQEKQLLSGYGRFPDDGSLTHPPGVCLCICMYFLAGGFYTYNIGS